MKDADYPTIKPGEHGAEDILAWLEKVITHVEQVAVEAARHLATKTNGGKRWTRSWDTVSVARKPGEPYLQIADCGHSAWTVTLHISLHDPEGVLRRCAADRKTLALHGGRAHSCPVIDSDGDLDVHARLYDHEACETVRALAEGYGWME